jgi:hypothetical protein
LKRFYLSKLSVLFSAFILLSIFPVAFTVVSDPFDNTEVSISPASQIVRASEDFYINVYCDPGQPIKAFEFKLSFDENLISAIEVTEGNIFNGYTTFFNSGTIDNNLGTIVDIYGLILGAGNTSNPGTLARINFTAKTTTGLSSLSLYEVGITNETEYVSINLTNGTVQVDVASPIISDVSATPATQEISGFVNVSATVTDNIALAGVFVNITYPDSSFENISIIANKTGNSYFTNKTYDDAGVYSYLVWAADTAGNNEVSASNMFVIGDLTSPQIFNVLLVSSNPLDTDSAFGWVNVSCDVTDNIGVDDVYINITNPDGSWNNLSLIPGAGSSFFINSSTAFSEVGNYSYFIWADDNDNNEDTSSTGEFSMPPNWDIDSNGVINIVDLVLVSNQYNQTGSIGWIREDVDNNGEVQVLDLVQISNHYSEIWWE